MDRSTARNPDTVTAFPGRRDERVVFSRAFATLAAAVFASGGSIIAASAASVPSRIALHRYCSGSGPPVAFRVPAHGARLPPSTMPLLRTSSSSTIVVATQKMAAWPNGRRWLPWLSQSEPLQWRQQSVSAGGGVGLCMTSSYGVSEEGDVEDDEDDEGEEAEPGTMRVSEIKAELKLRGVDFSDCFDRDSLAQRLSEARESGRADPSIIDDFNRKNLETNFEGGDAATELSDEQIEAVVSGDGTLPGGMTPETLKKLMSNPELMALLQSVKMQEVMKLMMTEGQEALEEAMRDDPEVREIVTKLNEVMGSAL